MAFNNLPVELNEHIACLLFSDKDIGNFMVTCKATHAAVESYRCGVYRNLFARRYDTPEGMTGQELKIKYKVRSRNLSRTTNWRMGCELKETRVMTILRDLINESYADVPLGTKGQQISKNVLMLRGYVESSGILKKVMSCLHRDHRFSPLLQTLQLVLTHLQLDLSMESPTLGFPWSQQAVYGHPDDFPMFKDRNKSKINIEFLLHTANFFKFHMTKKEAHTLYTLFHGLEDHQKPRAWDARLHKGPGVKKLGKHWKGSYAYLHEPADMRSVRANDPGTQIFTDSIDYHDGFQTLELDFSPASNTTSWPRAFESHLDAMPPLRLCKQLDHINKPKKARNVTYFVDVESDILPEEMLETPPSTPGVIRVDITLPLPDKILPLSAPLTPPLKSLQHGVHYHRFSGSGTDAERFHCNGILHPLMPQYDIPGWSRISLMKYFDPDTAGDSSPATQSYSSGSHSPNGSFEGISPTSSQSSNSSAATWPYPLDKPGSFTPINSARFPQADEDFNVTNGCWCYEGVALPGGKIILGRWWSPMQDDTEMICMGPFIFWEVDEDL